jgi:hypothetical protein
MAGLIITNGDAAAELLRTAGLRGTILPWRDILHEGPITAVDLAASSAERAPYLARRFGLSEADIAAEFAVRDALVRRHGEFDRIALWFEHDLYDQLQLVQVLAFLATVRRREGVALIQADEFLGRQTAQTILRFAERARPIEEDDLDLATRVWHELTLPTPEAIAARAMSPAPLPFLPAALRRFLEELPAPANGLSRTEQTVLDLIADGVADPHALFSDMIGREEAAFMGDWSFRRLVEDLAHADVPLIDGLPAGDEDTDGFFEAELSLTMAGDDVREGGEDHIKLSGLDRWWAGTHLLGRDVWRYDREARRLVRPGELGA